MDETINEVEEVREIKEKEEIELLVSEILSGETLIDEKPIIFEKRFFYDETLSVFLPKDFDFMDTEIVKIKYPSENRPNIIISDLAGLYSFMFNHTSSKLKKTEIKEFTDMMKTTLSRSNASIIFKSAGQKEINGKNIGFLEFISPALDYDIYNLMYFLSFDERALIIGFNCIKDLSNSWKNIAKAVFETLEIKEVE